MMEPWEEAADLEAREAKRLARLPKCDICGEAIDQYDAVRFHEFWICDYCLDDLRVLIEEEDNE